MDAASIKSLTIPDSGEITVNKKLAWFAGCTTLAMVVYFGTNLLRAQTAPAKVPIQGTEQRSRIALLNLHHVVKNYQKAVALNNEMKEVFTPLQVKTKAKTTQLEALNKEGQMKPEMRETIEKQMRVLKRELEDLSNEAQALIGKKQDEQVVLIYREVQEAAQRVAVAHGYDMVLHYNDPTTSAEYWSAGNIVRKMQAGACMPIYFAPGIDISADVVNALNQAYSRVAPPAAPAGSAITPTSATTPK
jgi:Skp family chaperone for outer membrane proteins